MAKRRLTAEAVVFDPAGRVLLVRQAREPGDWELPGGKVKKTESVVDAVAREVLEEAHVSVEPQQLIGVFFIREEGTYDFVIACRLVKPDSQPSPGAPEILECGFFPVDAPPKPIRPFTLQRIRDAIDNVTHPLPVELKSSQWLR
jgi:8-oxo-dGTP pyrophosphatase MutT (NUDIX family)